MKNKNFTLRSVKPEKQILGKTKIFDKNIIILTGVLVVMFFVLPYKSLSTEILIFAIGAMGFNLLMGYTGMLSFAQCSIFGGGAYFAGYLMIKFNIPPLLGLLGGAVFGAGLALVIGFLAIRKRGTYLALLTLALAQVVFHIAFQMKSITGGDDGLLGVPRRNIVLFPGIELNIQSHFSFFIFALTVFMICFVFIKRVVNSPLGHVLISIKENQDRTEAVGYNAKYYKLWAFCIAGFITGLAGALYALYMRMVPITTLELRTSDEFVLISLVGGLGSLYGPITGAFIVKVATEIFSQFMQRWMLLIGLLFIGTVLYMKRGIWGIIYEIREKRGAK